MAHSVPHLKLKAPFKKWQAKELEPNRPVGIKTDSAGATVLECKWAQKQAKQALKCILKWVTRFPGLPGSKSFPQQVLLCYLSLLHKNSGLEEWLNFRMWKNKGEKVERCVSSRAPGDKTGVKVSRLVLACSLHTSVTLSRTIPSSSQEALRASKGETSNIGFCNTDRNDKKKKRVWNKKILEESQGVCFPEIYNL